MTEENVIQTVLDPVCGMDVHPMKSEKTCYNGIELYFCSEICKSRFESAPQDFVVNKRRGFWRRYLERLNKATGGRPPSCHSV